MGEAKVQRGGKKNRKLGRNKTKCETYHVFHRREINKIKRMLRSNGFAYATNWASERGVSGLVNKVLHKS